MLDVKNIEKSCFFKNSGKARPYEKPFPMRQTAPSIVPMAFSAALIISVYKVRGGPELPTAKEDLRPQRRSVSGPLKSGMLT
jgi:hypothetical protein